jgi:hypothetical protein
VPVAVVVRVTVEGGGDKERGQGTWGTAGVDKRHYVDRAEQKQKLVQEAGGVIPWDKLS